MIGHDIALSWDMAYVCREFGDEEKVSGLARGAVHRAGDGADQRLVVRPSHEFAALEVMSEVVYGEIKSKELLIEGTIFHLGVGKLLREESERARNTSFQRFN